ncbi:MAG: KUP/HAK/KT family potassium transporter, partial [Roseiarcus sp.]
MNDIRSPRRTLAAATVAAQAEDRASHAPRGGIAALSIGALGVVYGDIGTSPLYAVDQIFSGPAGMARTPANALGSISLAIWTITLIVAVKYALLVLNAENDGEGGVFALYGLLHKYKRHGALVLLWSLMLGAGLLF